MSKNKLIVIFILTQIVLTFISLAKDIAPFNIEDLIGMPLLVCGWSLFAAIPAFLLNKKNIFGFTSIFVFFVVSSLNILGLLFIIHMMLRNGPLREAGLIFLGFPIYGFFALVSSEIVGMIIFLIKKKYELRIK